MTILIISLTASIITIIWTLFAIFKHKDVTSMPLVLLVVLGLSGLTAYVSVQYDQEREECVKQKRNYHKELQARKDLEVKYKQTLNLLNDKQEENVWLSLKESRDPIDIEQYLISFPNGKYKTFALSKYEKAIKNSKDPIYSLWIKPLKDIKYSRYGLYPFERYFFTNILSEKELEKIAGATILKENEYGYRGFRNYNAKFLRWVRDNLIPTPDRKILIEKSLPIYNSYFRREVRAHYLAYIYLRKDSDYSSSKFQEYNKCVKYDIKLHEINNDKNMRSTLDFFRCNINLNKAFSRRVQTSYSRLLKGESFHYAIGFWLRRKMNFDRDEEIIFQIFNNLLNAYDYEFYREVKTELK